MLNNILTALYARLADVRREEGQGMVEYALILVLVSVVSLVVLGLLGTNVQGVFTDVEGAIV